MLPYLRLEYPLLFLQVLDVPSSIFDYGSLVQLNLVNKKTKKKTIQIQIQNKTNYKH
jgi:aromatic ring-opening dioxygenase catalytic subunit (LigB family)